MFQFNGRNSAPSILTSFIPQNEVQVEENDALLIEIRVENQNGTELQSNYLMAVAPDCID